MLRRELARRSWKRDQVVVGTATDPYQPAEGRFRLTRGAIEALGEARTPIGLITRGPMIVRDVDVLAFASERAKVGVTFSIPTLDPEIWRLTEPGTAPPRQRLRALRTLVDAGIDASVGMAPILPGLSDDPAEMADVVRAARDAGATSIWTNVLYLRARHPRALPRQPRPRLAGAAADVRAAVCGPRLRGEGRPGARAAAGSASWPGSTAWRTGAGDRSLRPARTRSETGANSWPLPACCRRVPCLTRRRNAAPA